MLKNIVIRKYNYQDSFVFFTFAPEPNSKLHKKGKPIHNLVYLNN